MLSFPRSFLIHISVTKRRDLAGVPLQYFDSILKRRLHDKSLSYYMQVCRTLIKLCHVLPWDYPAMPFPGLAPPVPASPAVSCLFSAMLFVCPGSASTLATDLFTAVPIWSHPFLAFDLPYFLVLFDHSLPGQSRPALTFPWPVLTLPVLELPWSCPDISYPALPCSSLTPRLSVNCVLAIPWLL